MNPEFHIKQENKGDNPVGLQFARGVKYSLTIIFLVLAVFFVILYIYPPGGYHTGGMAGLALFFFLPIFVAILTFVFILIFLLSKGIDFFEKSATASRKKIGFGVLLFALFSLLLLYYLFRYNFGVFEYILQFFIYFGFYAAPFIVIYVFLKIIYGIFKSISKRME